MRGSSKARTATRPMHRSAAASCFAPMPIWWTAQRRKPFPTPTLPKSSSAISASPAAAESGCSNSASSKKQSPRPKAGQGLGKRLFWLGPPDFRTGRLARTSARPAAAGRVVEADIAAAAVLAAAIKRLTARLHDRAARLVAAAAGDAAAVGRVFALADAAGEVALANGQAVQGRAARAQSARERLAKILQRGAGHVVVADAVDLEPLFAFFESQLAARHNTPAGCGCAGGQTSRRGGDSRVASRAEEQTSLQDHRARHRNDSFQRPAVAQPLTGGCILQDIDRLGTSLRSS